MSNPEAQASDDTEAPEADLKKPDQESPEDKARIQGWRPKEEWTGDPTKWRDAEAFLAVGERSAPVAAKRNVALEKQNKRLLDDLNEIRSTMRDLVAGQKAERDRAVSSALANLKAQKKIAVQEADTARVDAIDEQIDQLKEAPKTEGKDPEEKREAQPLADWSEDEKKWIKGNPWMSPKSQYYDPYLARTALGYYDLLEADPDTQELDGAEKLKLVSAEMRRRFPEKFQNANRRNAPAVEGGNGSSPRGNGKKSWNDLPQEAKTMGERLINQKVIKDRQTYVDQYPW